MMMDKVNAMAKEDMIDPICGMKGHIKAHGKYFCSEHCIMKYEKQNKLKPEAKASKKEFCPSCASEKGTHWYGEKLFIFGAILAALFIASYFIKPMNPVFDALVDYSGKIWWAVLLGLLIGGMIDYLVPREYVSKMLASKKKRTIFTAVGLGFLMSACSHGILAISMELYKKGASVASVIAFLLASPWANIAITILLFSFFGAKALFIMLSAIVIAVITGLIYQVLERKGLVETNKNHAIIKEDFSIRKDIAKRMKAWKFNVANSITLAKGVGSGMLSLSKMVMWWIFLGIMMSSLARAFVPQDFFMKYLGASVLGLLITLALATLIEVCSEGSSPMAFEIFRQTGAFGNSFVFLMAGVATDYTEIGLIWSNIGRKAALWLPIITVPMILALGFVFNLIF